MSEGTHFSGSPLSEEGQRRREVMLGELLGHVPKAAARRRRRKRAAAGACVILLLAGAALVTVQIGTVGRLQQTVVEAPQDAETPPRRRVDIAIARTHSAALANAIVDVNLGSRVQIIDDASLLTILEDDLGQAIGMMRKGNEVILSANDFVQEIPIEASG